MVQLWLLLLDILATLVLINMGVGKGWDVKTFRCYQIGGWVSWHMLLLSLLGLLTIGQYVQQCVIVALGITKILNLLVAFLGGLLQDDCSVVGWGVWLRLHQHVIILSSVLIHLILSLVNYIGHKDMGHLFSVFPNILSLVVLNCVVLLFTSQVRGTLAPGSTT